MYDFFFLLNNAISIHEKLKLDIYTIYWGTTEYVPCVNGLWYYSYKFNTNTFEES